MANTKSAKKRAKTAEKKGLVNLAKKSEVKTLSKKVLEALEKKNVELAKSELKKAEAKIASAKSKRVFKGNTASRKISALAKKVAALVRGAA